jgi:hypothetical protein
MHLSGNQNVEIWVPAAQVSLFSADNVRSLGEVAHETLFNKGWLACNLVRIAGLWTGGPASMTRQARPYEVFAVWARKGHKKAKGRLFIRLQSSAEVALFSAKGSPWRMEQKDTNVASLKGYWAGCAEWWSRRQRGARESDSSNQTTLLLEQSGGKHGM